ncbi:hypothetical protein CRG98_001763, partial [Punica granatum]
LKSEQDQSDPSREMITPFNQRVQSLFDFDGSNEKSKFGVGVGGARGCGSQKQGVFVNLRACYLVGIPCAILPGFVFQFSGKGLWLEMICALTVQVSALLLITL